MFLHSAALFLCARARTCLAAAALALQSGADHEIRYAVTGPVVF